MKSHVFVGKWITDAEFFDLKPRNVFHRQLEPVDLPCDEHRNRHILFRKTFSVEKKPQQALLYITADDYYKLYINGKFVTQGPAPAYTTNYGYNVIDVSAYIKAGNNTLAVHTLYQGLINRVWVSGDRLHGMICDLVADGVLLVKSDESFLTAPHSGYAESGTVGYDTQFLESYDSAASQVGFEKPGFDDSGWEHAKIHQHAEYTLTEQRSKALAFEVIEPRVVEQRGDTLFVDFGSIYVGYLVAQAQGSAGAEILVRCGQELQQEGSVRYRMRCNCDYEETWRLSGGQDTLDWFDYKSFRYAELQLPTGCTVQGISLLARHYPFNLKARLKPEYVDNKDLQRIWELCVNSIRYGVQEVIHDCMDREKGFYLGDGCFSALTQMVLTGDDSLVRKMIDEAFYGAFITPGLVTCLDCAFMQEIAEYPLILIALVFWHYRITGDREYLGQNYPRVCSVLDAYRREYEQNGLLQNLNKWCVVDWPASFRDGYDVDITEGRVCEEPHVALNAYYLEAIHYANASAQELGLELYRDTEELQKAFTAAFYDERRHLFRDSDRTEHISYIGNIFPYAFGLCPDEECRTEIERMIEERGVADVSFFGCFALLTGLVRNRRSDLLKANLLHPGAWLRMLREGATTTFEGWGKEVKWNTSLFHLAMSDGALFLADIDLEALFRK